ncbi:MULTISPECIES: hypothetical protein [unclassified Janthinobacterium]|uniref:hypothetical protein n=1 Tax=unclassified Janthinobacterium TaxID=2610881 RepID=UPI0016134551|nr:MULTISPECIES: hypothetical protein [unclassified Janthinobacterium]MBB5608965.1 hypothetical protein [Janthinobacterium sp. S3T4]MBB5615180.1 hypothetical protein [Janthinobacterium sp. S3M3]
MKTPALLLAATLMTVGGAWVQAQSTSNVNQTGNHTNNPNDPGQKSDQSDKLDNKGQPIHDGKPAKQRTDKRSKHNKPAPPPVNGRASTPPDRPAAPSIPVAPKPPITN